MVFVHSHSHSLVHMRDVFMLVLDFLSLDAVHLHDTCTKIRGYVRWNWKSNNYKHIKLRRNALEDGNIHAMQILQGIKFTWDRDTCELAAYCGHLQFMKWAIHFGCPFHLFCIYDEKNGFHEINSFVRDISEKNGLKIEKGKIYVFSGQTYMEYSSNDVVTY